MSLIMVHDRLLIVVEDFPLVFVGKYYPFEKLRNFNSQEVYILKQINHSVKHSSFILSHLKYKINDFLQLSTQ